MVLYCIRFFCTVSHCHVPCYSAPANYRVVHLVIFYRFKIAFLLNWSCFTFIMVSAQKSHENSIACDVSGVLWVPNQTKWKDIQFEQFDKYFPIRNHGMKCQAFKRYLKMWILWMSFQSSSTNLKGHDMIKGKAGSNSSWYLQEYRGKVKRQSW